MYFKVDKLRSHTKAYPSQNDNSQRCGQNLEAAGVKELYLELNLGETIPDLWQPEPGASKNIYPKAEGKR